LIARRVREAGVYCEIHPNDVGADFIRAFAPKGVILGGSHMSAYEESTDRAADVVFSLGVPVLGICYGMQTMAQQMGGRVEGGHTREFGYAEARARGHTRLLDGLQDFATDAGHGMLKVWMSHGDKVVEMPPGFKLMASTENCPIAGMADEQRRFYGVQFHLEVTHTAQGAAILRRFVRDICGCRGDWNMPDYVTEAVTRIRTMVGKEEVILGLSGGVDSSVAAALIHKAIGHQLTCVFVDTGLLRLNEAQQVIETFQRHMGLKLIAVDAGQRFLKELAGVADPEAKRKIIGREFVHVFQEQAALLSNARWLAQGTIYPDVIESAGAKTKKATTIKSHHNVGGLPETLHLKLLEPLRGRSSRRLLIGRRRAVRSERESSDALEVIHMNDYPDKPTRARINDSHRVYPGDGVAPLKQVITDLSNMGGTKVLSLELFNREYWKSDPLTVAKTGLEKMRKVVASV